jgi:hypothetical protein
MLTDYINNVPSGLRKEKEYWSSLGFIIVYKCNAYIHKNYNDNILMRCGHPVNCSNIGKANLFKGDMSYEEANKNILEWPTANFAIKLPGNLSVLDLDGVELPEKIERKLDKHAFLKIYTPRGNLKYAFYHKPYIIKGAYSGQPGKEIRWVHECIMPPSYVIINEKGVEYEYIIKNVESLLEEEQIREICYKIVPEIVNYNQLYNNTETLSLDIPKACPGNRNNLVYYFLQKFCNTWKTLYPNLRPSGDILTRAVECYVHSDPGFGDFWRDEEERKKVDDMIKRVGEQHFSNLSEFNKKIDIKKLVEETFKYINESKEKTSLESKVDQYYYRESVFESNDLGRQIEIIIGGLEKEQTELREWLKEGTYHVNRQLDYDLWDPKHYPCPIYSYDVGDSKEGLHYVGCSKILAQVVHYPKTESAANCLPPYIYHFSDLLAQKVMMIDSKSKTFFKDITAVFDFLGWRPKIEHISEIYIFKQYLQPLKNVIKLMIKNAVCDTNPEQAIRQTLFLPNITCAEDPDEYYFVKQLQIAHEGKIDSKKYNKIVKQIASDLVLLDNQIDILPFDVLIKALGTKEEDYPIFNYFRKIFDCEDSFKFIPYNKSELPKRAEKRAIAMFLVRTLGGIILPSDGRFGTHVAVLMALSDTKIQKTRTHMTNVLQKYHEYLKTQVPTKELIGNNSSST